MKKYKALQVSLKKSQREFNKAIAELEVASQKAKKAGVAVDNAEKAAQSAQKKLNKTLKEIKQEKAKKAAKAKAKKKFIIKKAKDKCRKKRPK